MEYDYLKQFPKRMKKVGAYATLIRNSYGKLTWKQFGFEDYDEQENLIFTVMLYIMEQSLKDEPCTTDDIGAFLDVINTAYFNKPLSYDMCRELGNFIVNVILGNEGKATYYQAYNYEEKEYERLYISFLANKIIYDENEVRRTSYYITEDGYNLLLGTLEIDQNMRLTIQEMIFKMQLEKASYDKAVDTIKNIFNQLRIQLRNMEEASRKIKKNPLAYTVADYKEQLTNNLAVITCTRDKFQQYHEHIQQKVRDLEEKDINIKKLETEEKDNLDNLRIIQSYLSRAIDEHQKILSSHFDLKDLYSKELENLSQMILIKRFQLRICVEKNRILLVYKENMMSILRIKTSLKNCSIVLVIIMDKSKKIKK